MKRIRIPETDLSVSSMGCGCVNAGLKWEGKNADEVFDAFFDLGGIFTILREYIPTGFPQKLEEVKEYWESGFPEAINEMKLCL